MFEKKRGEEEEKNFKKMPRVSAAFFYLIKKKEKKFEGDNRAKRGRKKMRVAGITLKNLHLSPLGGRGEISLRSFSRAPF